MTETRDLIEQELPADSTFTQSVVGSHAPAEESTLLKLDSSLTIAEVAGLQGSMRSLLESAMTLTLNGSSVEQVDGAGIQLLAAFINEAANRRIEIHWTGVSLPLRSAAVQLSLDAFLGLEECA